LLASVALVTWMAGSRLFGVHVIGSGLLFPTGGSGEQLEASGGADAIGSGAGGGSSPNRSAGGGSSGYVAPPMQIDIPSIGVQSSLVRLGLNADRTVQVPSSFSIAGWYQGSAQPGDWGKPAVILGHVDSTSGPAVFYRLKSLQPGASIWVLRSDHTWVRFVVLRVGEYPKDHFPTKLVYAPHPGRTLRLVTCGGAFNYATGHYVDNIIAFARIV